MELLVRVERRHFYITCLYQMSAVQCCGNQNFGNKTNRPVWNIAIYVQAPCRFPLLDLWSIIGMQGEKLLTKHYCWRPYLYTETQLCECWQSWATKQALLVITPGTAARYFPKQPPDHYAQFLDHTATIRNNVAILKQVLNKNTSNF